MDLDALDASADAAAATVTPQTTPRATPRPSLTAPSSEERGRCARCGEAAGHLHRCSGCRQVLYCSKACQKTDWPAHRVQCFSVEDALLATSGDGDDNVGAKGLKRRYVAVAALAQLALFLATVFIARAVLRAADTATRRACDFAGVPAGRTPRLALWCMAAFASLWLTLCEAGARRRRACRAVAVAGVAVLELRKARARGDEQRYKSVGIFLYGRILELGGLWVKTGQYAAARSDVLPRALSKELRPLADGVPAPPVEGALKAAVARELGLETLTGPQDGPRKGARPFAAFESEAMAASSVAQVHRAEVWADDAVDQGGDTYRVAVKVVRPGARARIQDDLALLGCCVRCLTVYDEDLRFLRGAFRDYAQAVARELDLTNEARTTRDARAALDGGFRGGTVVPRVVEGYAARGALCLSLEEGFRADDGDALDRHRLDRPRVFGRAVRAVARGLFGEGLCHADPHPGNVSVRPDPYAPDGFEVVLLDWGLCARLGDDARVALAGAAYATFARDDALARSSLDALAAACGLNQDDETRRRLVVYVSHLLHDGGSGRGRRASRRAGARHPSPLLDDVAGLPPELLLVLRSVAMLRGLAATLDVAGDRLADELVGAAARGLEGHCDAAWPPRSPTRGAREARDRRRAERKSQQTDGRSPRKRGLQLRSPAASAFDLPALVPADPPPPPPPPGPGWSVLRPLTVRGRRVSPLEFWRRRHVDLRRAVRRAARVCAYHDVALIRVAAEAPDAAAEAGADDSDGDDFSDLSDLDAVFDAPAAAAALDRLARESAA